MHPRASAVLLVGGTRVELRYRGGPAGPCFAIGVAGSWVETGDARQVAHLRDVLSALLAFGGCDDKGVADE